MFINPGSSSRKAGTAENLSEPVGNFEPHWRKLHKSSLSDQYFAALAWGFPFLK
jgi:hypothetical protein